MMTLASSTERLFRGKHVAQTHTNGGFLFFPAVNAVSFAAAHALIRSPVL